MSWVFIVKCTCCGKKFKGREVIKHHLEQAKVNFLEKEKDSETFLHVYWRHLIINANSKGMIDFHKFIPWVKGGAHG